MVPIVRPGLLNRNEDYNFEIHLPTLDVRLFLYIMFE